MKRSEVLTFLLNEYHFSQRGGMSEMSDKERIDYLLTQIEKVMEPPPRLENDADPEDPNEWYTNTWEPEDE